MSNRHSVPNQQPAPSGLQFNLIPLKDLAKGIDFRSAESNLQEGYCEDLVNVDTVSNGQIVKRHGYQGFGGYVPMRVRQISHDGYQISMKLAQSIDLTGVPPSPIVVYGKFDHSESGDFGATAGVKAYPSFSVDVRDIFSTSATSTTKAPSDTGVTSPSLFVFVEQSTSETDASSTWMVPDTVQIDKNTYIATINYTPPTTERVYIEVVDKVATAGTSYVRDCSSAPIVLSGGLISGTATAATHGLGNFNIIPRFYSLSGTTYTQIIPDSFTINATTGDAAFSWTDTTNFTGQIILANAPANQYQQQSIAAGSTGTLVVTGLTTNFPLWALYRLNGANWEQVLPDSMVVNAAAGTMTFTMVNSSSSPENYALYYDFATISASTIRVVDSSATSTAYAGTVINNPQLTVWGIGHAGRYTSKAVRGGQVLHLDSYKRNTEARLVSGLGGNLYAARTRAEIGGTYSLPLLAANLSARLANNISIAPLFQPTGTSSSVRTRGIITGDNVSNGYAVVTGVSYVGPGIADYSLSLANKAGTLTLGGQVSTTDYLTVTGMAHTVHNGVFQVLSVTAQDAVSVTLRVSNQLLQVADFNETNALGSGNVYTDNLVVTSNPNFVAGDVLTAGSIPSTLVLTVLSVSGTTLSIAGVTQQLSMANGLQVFGTRTAQCLPLKNSANAPSVAGLVRGDMVTVGSLTRLPRVTYLNPFQDMSCSLTVAGGTATVSLGSTKTISSVSTGASTFTCPSHGFSTNDPILLGTTGSLPTGLRSDTVYYVSVADANTFQIAGKEGGAAVALTSTGSGVLTAQRVHNLSVGQRITISQTGDPLLDGVQTVSAVPSRGTFTFQTATSTVSTSGVMVGRTAEFDETLTISDALATPTAVSVDTRWIPVEAPSSVSTLPKSAYVSYFNDTADNMRSCVVGGNMYFTNGVDPVMKFDGANLYQAGLFRWQPHLFAEVDTSVTSLTLDSIQGTVNASSAGNKFVVGVGEGAQFQAGNRIVHSADNALYTVQSVQTGVASATNDYVYVTATISGAASGTIKKTKTYHYYARLNAIDANNNVVASAATGSIDLVVELAAAGQIRLRLVGLPAWGVYDYDRLELQLYRAVADTPAPFYRIRSVPISFSAGNSYIDILDGTSDDVLKQSGNLDDTMTALKGAELGTAWEQPPIANYMCAVNNRLVLANISDYPQLDLVLKKKAGVASLATSDLTGLSFLLKKASTDTGTATDMVNRSKYVFVNSGATTIVPANITRTSTTFTVPTASPPAVGSWVYLFQSAASTTKSLQFAGWFQVASVVAGTSFTVNFANSYTASSADVDRFVTAPTPTDIPVWLGTDGNYSAIKFGNTSLSYEGVAAVRLANAVNASMVATDTSQTAFASFVPWVTANAGSEYQNGQVSLRVPKYSATFLAAVLGTIGSNYDVYANNIKQSSSAQVSARALVFPSRVVISYQNYPETFDAPAAALQADSDSIVDVNSADGEAITGIIPFFSQSAFTAAQVSNVIVVFKTNSIYILDIATREVQKIDSQGLGCTAPYSIAATRNGIMFANLSGVYRLNQTLTVSYAGKYIERYWRDNVNAAALAYATATNYGIGRQYKLSVPVGSDATNSVVLVYDHTRETPAYANIDEGFGAWTRYTNHRATGWCNLNSDSYFATSDGQVFKVRRANDQTDFRDDAGPVDTMQILLRAMDGGLPGVRKACRAIITHMRLEKSGVTGTVISAAVENANSFQTIGTIVKSFGDKKVVAFRSTPPTQHFVYITLKYTNSTKDENFVLAGVDLLLAVLGVQGVAQRSGLS